LSVKPLDEFYRHSMMADGHLNKCKECAKKDVRQNRADNRDYYILYDKKKYLRKVGGSYLGRYTISDEERGRRRKASTAVGNALRDGRLKKMECWVCGGPAQGHHPDYDSPLDVVWLCPKHHKEAHAISHQEYLENNNAAAA
jgi:hypothetical protein